tara:strand:+ start:3951 stop:5348 length:1398 start_codon:yes stop_codon:yes gene_type:complete
MRIKLAKTELIHFVGIGGIGMSGLALIMNSLGFKIRGSDANNNKNIERLKKNKIKIIIGHKKKNIKKSTILVVSSAIKKNNPEYKEALKKKIPIYKRGEVLGHIVSLMNNIAVAGSHGKTTTTSLISNIFTKTNLDPTIINGGIINSLGSSAKLGKSDWCILETDESDGSFLKIPKTYSIATNIDEEHMDYYKNLNNLKKNFTLFIDKTPSFGKSFLCIDDKNIKNILKKINHKNFLTYGLDKNSNYRIYNVRQNIDNSIFNLRITLPGLKKKIIKNIKIPMIGIHNVKNATASFAVTNTIGISVALIKKGLNEFKGVQRRFNKLFTFRESVFYDDYAHHPTEIEEVLNGVKDVCSDKKIVCVFQPHRISRLKFLRKKFVSAFKKADTVLLCPVYKAGESISLGFSYKKFANEIISKSKVKLILIKNQNELLKYTKKNIYGQKIVIGMGAGSISSWMRDLKKILK